MTNPFPPSRELLTPLSYFPAGLPALHPSVLAGLPALHPATPFEKGVDPKTFSADGQHTFYGRAKNPECRIRCFLGAGLWIPIVAPFLTLFAGLPALHPATPFEKGVDPKTFSVGGQHTFYGEAKNLVYRSRCSLGTGLWIPCAVPSVGVLCSRAWWEASSESPWVFGDASLLHDLKRLGLFRRDEVPARNTHKIVRLCLHEPKKVFEGSKGRFFKNAPLAGCGTASHKRRANQPVGARLFRRDEIPARNTHKIVRLRLYALKKFLRVPRGGFSKTRPWQGVGRRPTKREQTG